jgi:hypothetical protein
VGNTASELAHDLHFLGLQQLGLLLLVLGDVMPDGKHTHHLAIDTFERPVVPFDEALLSGGNRSPPPPNSHRESIVGA